jgi:hypothetical protein
MSFLHKYRLLAEEIIISRLPDCRDLPAEYLTQPQCEIACALIFNSVGIITNEQKEAVITRNIQHLGHILKYWKVAPEDGR